MLIAASAAICFVVFLSQNAFASFLKEGHLPGSKTTKAIHEDFPRAGQITWIQEGEDFVAKFEMYERKVTAIYNSEGRLLSTLILIPGQNMPFEIRIKLVRKYPDYEVECAKEYVDKAGSSYFFILKKQEGNRIDWLSMKSNEHGGFTRLQKLSQHP